MAATENEAGLPEVTVRGMGCRVIAGGVSTVRVAPRLVTVPWGLVTRTE